MSFVLKLPRDKCVRSRVRVCVWFHISRSVVRGLLSLRCSHGYLLVCVKVPSH